MFPDSSSRSAKLYERACAVMPGGNTRLTTYMSPYQLYAVRGSGSRVYDADGVERIDFQNNYTTLIHGHSHPSIVAKVVAQIERGTCFGLATESEIALAELLTSRCPSFERIRFVNSGTEACMMAIAAARAHTKRSLIAKCEGAYHGSSDFAQISVTSNPDNWNSESDWAGSLPATLGESVGTPTGVLQNVIVVPFNDCAMTAKILRHHANELAAVIVDPLPPRIGLIPAHTEYLELLRQLTRETGSVLIFDEVISFRLGYRGAQGEAGVLPDLTALGKIIGGGFPVGAVAGSEEVMSVFDPRSGRPKVRNGGTFNANPVTMVAGHAAMEMLTPEAFARLAEMGKYARSKIAEAFSASGVDGQVTGAGSLFRIHCTARPMSGYRSAYPTALEKERVSTLIRQALNRGILLTEIGAGAISTVMEMEDLDRAANAVYSALEEMKRERVVA